MRSPSNGGCYGDVSALALVHPVARHRCSWYEERYQYGWVLHSMRPRAGLLQGFQLAAAWRAALPAEDHACVFPNHPYFILSWTFCMSFYITLSPSCDNWWTFQIMSFAMNSQVEAAYCTSIYHWQLQPDNSIDLGLLVLRDPVSCTWEPFALLIGWIPSQRADGESSLVDTSVEGT